MDRRKLRGIVQVLDDGGMASVHGTIAALKELGAVRNVHVGKQSLNDLETVEWYAGQVLDVLESESWFAVNSVINLLDRFVPADMPALEGAT